NHWYLLRLLPYFIAENKIDGIVLVFVNIDKVKKQQEDILQLAAIVESSEDAVIAKNLNGVITVWNASAERIFGYKKHEAIGQNSSLIVPPELEKEEEDVIDMVKKKKHMGYIETTRVTKTGKRILVSIAVSPIKDEDGKTIGASKIVRDITRQRHD